ncbi:hypothetical protein Y032_0023g803 [Ancylostoma ceylanicum]|uniref:Uncharacterized protein n=1 Tax=Ancylostoma ceylanicum TaxID=53326 RepID=A0A016UZS5_9BILA|nr:hypothetical protein Y032_0023g803 [Ancylostoma ceylanicum]
MAFPVGPVGWVLTRSSLRSPACGLPAGEEYQQKFVRVADTGVRVEVDQDDLPQTWETQPKSGQNIKGTRTHFVFLVSLTGWRNQFNTALSALSPPVIFLLPHIHLAVTIMP